MAVRKKSGGSEGTGASKKAAPKKGAVPAKTSMKKAATARKKSPITAEELQTVGADIVPEMPVEVARIVEQPDETLSEAGPILPDAAPKPRAAKKSVKPIAKRSDRSAAFQAAGPPASSRRGATSGAAPAGIEPTASEPANFEKWDPQAEATHTAAAPEPTHTESIQPAQPDSPMELSEAFEATFNAGVALDAAGPFEETAVPAMESATETQAAVSASETRPDTLLSDWDLHLFNEGTHTKLWKKLGNHIVPGGVMFGVWAPNADRVSVVGDFNAWDPDANPMQVRGQSGIWEGFVPGLERGATYKYRIVSRGNHYTVNKADPMAVHQETPPATASKVWDLDYSWNDDEWMRNRGAHNSYEAPMSIYEVHLGSWRRTSDDGGHTWRSMSYREIAQPLAEYVKKMNFTHIELMPVQEHPFYGSWGYQGTGYYAPTSRYGTPQDFKYLVDVLHQHGIAVILDWVPSHFPSDEHGLGYFDGTHLYEHSDPRKGFQPDWGSLVFNYGRNEVRAFLGSNAMYWLEEYHIDGLRVDAVASMLYLDYSRKAGEWVPNEFGGRENIEAISFLRRMNEDVYKEFPDVQVIAEESTAWPMVSRPTYIGGLGFGMKWDMGWMHDTLRYFAKDPVHRRFHHNDLTFRMMYAFTENFVLPLSHDEVVHGKGSLIGKMPGDDWRRFANLRLLFSHMYANPGKKLLFMGGDIAQYREWNHDNSLDWELLGHPAHAGANRWLEDLNKAYRDIPAMHELDMSPDGFEWIDCCDTENSIVSLMRRSKSRPDEMLVVVLNFTPEPRYNYQIGVPRSGHWREMLNSDAAIYGGSGQGNMGGIDAVPLPMHGRRWSATLTLPPLGAVFLLSSPEATEADRDLESAEGEDVHDVPPKETVFV
jgi:1,4-alpha-glucan branching enzyme